MISAAQNIIENPAEPNAGRMVTLEEEMRIEDTGKGFYLKRFGGLRVSPDGASHLPDEEYPGVRTGKEEPWRVSEGPCDFCFLPPVSERSLSSWFKPRFPDGGLGTSRTRFWPRAAWRSWGKIRDSRLLSGSRIRYSLLVFPLNKRPLPEIRREMILRNP